jgi:hypothetical protein
LPSRTTIRAVPIARAMLAIFSATRGSTWRMKGSDSSAVHRRFV